MKLFFPFLFLAIYSPAIANAAASEKNPITGIHIFPNERELTKEDYALVGEVIWRQLQAKADPAKRELDSEDIKKLVDDMERGGERILLTLTDFQSLLQSRQLWCGTLDSSPGVDLGKVVSDLKELIE